MILFTAVQSQAWQEPSRLGHNLDKHILERRLTDPPVLHIQIQLGWDSAPKILDRSPDLDTSNSNVVTFVNLSKLRYCIWAGHGVPG